MSIQQFPWPEEAVDLLKVMWESGESCSVIASAISAHFQEPVSRNAVIGKRARLGLEQRKQASAARKYVRRSQHVVRIDAAATANIQRAAAKPPVFKIIPLPPPEPTAGVTELFDLDRNGCRWPSGDGPFLFCNAPQFKGCDTQYCEHHFNMSCRDTRRPSLKYTKQLVQHIHVVDAFGPVALAAEAAA